MICVPDCEKSHPHLGTIQLIVQSLRPDDKLQFYHLLTIRLPRGRSWRIRATVHDCCRGRESSSSDTGAYLVICPIRSNGLAPEVFKSKSKMADFSMVGIWRMLLL